MPEYTNFARRKLVRDEGPDAVVDPGDRLARRAQNRVADRPDLSHRHAVDPAMDDLGTPAAGR